MNEDLLNIMASRKSGVFKSEYFYMCERFKLPINKTSWNRFVYVHGKGVALPVYSETGKWYCYDRDYYRSLVEFVHKNPKGVTYMGMAMGVLPSWIDDNHELFVNLFRISDY
jgi:hypothetical protein